MNPVLLLHGALGANTQLEKIKLVLEQNGRVVFSMDFSGHHGRPYSIHGFGIDAFAMDVYDFLEEHSLSQVDIFGYSMGGYVALWLAYQRPELIGQIITFGTKFDWSPASAEKEIKKMNPEKIQEKIPAFAQILERRHQPNDWKEVLYRTAEMMKQLGHQPLLTEEIIGKIKNKTLVCLGDQDEMADLGYSKAVAKMLPNGEFRLLENTGHAIEAMKFRPFID
jgi:pimeloyl-ACP methyl ester carboxylesterase